MKRKYNGIINMSVRKSKDQDVVDESSSTQFIYLIFYSKMFILISIFIIIDTEKKNILI